MATPSFIRFGRRAVVAGGLLNEKHKLNGIKVINSTGSDIAADKLVAVVGYNTTNKLPKIVLADANDATHKDVYVTLATIGNGDEGFVYKGGLSAATLNTSSVSAAGDPVYLSETAGGFTATAPYGTSSVLPVGWVIADSSTVGQIHWHIGEPERVDLETEVVTAANTITAAENGKVFFLNSATEFASTLPAPFGGAHYTFIVTAAPSGASYTVVTEGGCQILAGSVHAATKGDSGDIETTAAGTTVTFVDGAAVVGDQCELWSDGTSWFAQCFCSTLAGITITG